jgi:hypothetical protein
MIVGIDHMPDPNPLVRGDVQIDVHIPARIDDNRLAGVSK